MKKTDMLFLEAIYLYTSANLSPSKQFVTVQIPKFLQYKIIGVYSIISLSFFIHQTIMIIEKRVKLLPLELDLHIQCTCIHCSAYHIYFLHYNLLS